jgi:hypothetical protein
VLGEGYRRLVVDRRAPSPIALTRWPSESATHPYKYTGDRYLHQQEPGKFLEPGDVVQLTHSQSVSLADRFEAID